MRERKKTNIELYDSKYTDEALQHLRDNAEVEYIAFNLTDISDQGILELATLPNLKGILLYGGRGITNQGILHLKQLPKLERLILRNTQVNDDGILLLKELSQLKYLALDDDRHGGPIFTDNALANLSQLTQLKSIDIGGSWATSNAINQLVRSLPSCTIQQHQYSSPDHRFELY